MHLHNSHKKLDSAWHAACAGEEITSLATWAAPEPLMAGASVWFHDSGRLSDYQARYDCLCSSCLGPERVYTFTLPSSNPQACIPPILSAYAPAGPGTRAVVPASSQGPHMIISPWGVLLCAMLRAQRLAVRSHAA